jgi:ABC-type Fe3+ transport system substrate-binding protein
LARGKLAIAIGPTYYRFEAFLRAGLPVKPFPTFKEGTYMSVGVDAPVIFKNLPHPNAAKVFVNWFLSKRVRKPTVKFMDMPRAAWTCRPNG